MYQSCSNNTCPHCQARRDTFQVFEDKGHRQTILELKIYCPNKDLGCGWTGELSHQDTHLNFNFEIGSERKGCQYVELACIHCSEIHPRYHMLGCLLQQYTCPCCEHYSASYRDIISHHMLECEEFPVPCSICSRKVARKFFEVHRTECSLKHSPLHGSAVTLPNIDCLTHVFVPPPPFIMTNFTHHRTSGEQWFSSPFYSHIGGYKMCISVAANGEGSGAGTHVSVFVRLMQGEYDDNLVWPFRGTIILQLINRRMNKGHMENIFPFDDSTPKHIAGRVSDGRQALGYGRLEFIPQSILRYNEFWNTEYLKNGSLEFQVTCVDIAEKFSVSFPNLQPSSDTALDQTHQVQPVPPVTIVMREFMSTKMQGISWYSPPFYSHLGGYKFCINVIAAGWWTSAGTHVSVLVHLMRGEYDDNLSWPFRGAVTLRLVNHRGDVGHVEHTVEFDDSAPSDAAGRVTGDEEALHGLGVYKFIPHSDLSYEYNNVEFLKNDFLEFRVTHVEVFSLSAPVVS